jgi:4-amino-4-deoxy-L-arabinose transferase-like glycosyltransferase
MAAVAGPGYHERSAPPDLRPASENESSPSGLPSPGYFRPHAAVVLLIVIFFGVIRWRLAAMPLERDEGEYAYAGQLMLRGIPPYQFAYNMKLPGTYAAYAVIMAILGETPQGIHLGLLAVNAATVVLIFVLASRLFGLLAGTIAAATYALLSTHQSTLGFAAHATHFLAICAIAGLILLLRAEESGKLSTFFFSGLFFGLALVMKQPGVFFGIFGFVYVIFVHLRRPPVNWKLLTKRSAIFLAGGGGPFLVTCLVLWRAGVFGNFWFWTISYARQYSGLVSLKDGWVLFTFHFWPMLTAAPLIWIIALFGLSAIVWYRPARRHALLLVGFFVFSVLAVSSGLYFRSHYFVVGLPAIALLTGLGVSCAMGLLNRYSKVRALPALLFLIALAWAVGKNSRFYFRLTPTEACHAVYVNSPFVDALTVAQYLEQHTNPTDRIMVLGSEPEIYFYAHRLSASGYIYAYPLMEKQPFWQTMQSQMMQEVQSNHPLYMVYFNHPAAFLTTMGSSRLAPYIEWADAYLKKDYEKVGRVDLVDPASHYSWGAQANNTKPETQYSIFIFKRKQQNVATPGSAKGEMPGTSSSILRVEDSRSSEKHRACSNPVA